MAFSSGGRAAVSELAAWGAAGALCVFAFLYYGEIRTFVLAGLGFPDDGGFVVSERSSGRQSAARRSAPDATEAQRSSSLAGAVELKAARNGHFYASADINGRSIDVMVDTGASVVALTYEDAERAGIFVRARDFTHRVSTANGQARVAPVTLDSVSIGGVRVRNVPAVVSERGRLETTLLGMAFLGRLARVEMRSGKLLLEE